MGFSMWFHADPPPWLMARGYPKVVQSGSPGALKTNGTHWLAAVLDGVELWSPYQGLLTTLKHGQWGVVESAAERWVLENSFGAYVRRVLDA